MNVLIFYQTTLFTAYITTLIIYLQIQYYACTDVLSDGSVDWMSYCTLHTYMGTALNVYVHALSDYSCE